MGAATTRRRLALHVRELPGTRAPDPPFAKRGPRGPLDGEPVLVIPGFLAATRPPGAAQALAEAGFRVHGWELGWNLGARADTHRALPPARRKPRPRQADPDRRLEPRRRLRPRARPPPPRTGHARSSPSARPFSRRPAPEQRLAPLRMGRRAPGRPTRRSRASPTSRRSPTSPSGRARDGIDRPRAPPAACRTNATRRSSSSCHHMAFGVSPQHRAAGGAEINSFLKSLG